MNRPMKHFELLVIAALETIWAIATSGTAGALLAREHKYRGEHNE